MLCGGKAWENKVNTILLLFILKRSLISAFILTHDPVEVGILDGISE